jgi:hypothetical protein
MSTPSVVMTVGDRQSDRKITVASLCCDSGEAKSAPTEPTEQRHLHGSDPRSSPDVVPIRAQGRYLGRLDAAVDLPSSLVIHLGALDDPGLATQPSRVTRSDTVNSSTKTPYRLSNPGSMAVSFPPTLFATPDSSKAVHKYQGADPRVQSMD